MLGISLFIGFWDIAYQKIQTKFIKFIVWNSIPCSIPYKQLKCLCIEIFEYFFPTEIENLVFLVHDDNIFFALAGVKGIEISVCFEALDANFWWPLRDVIPRIKARTFSRPTEVC